MIGFTSDAAPLISSTFTGLVADPSIIFHQEEHGVSAIYNTALYRSTLTGAARHTPENIGYKVCNEKFLLSVLLYFLLFIYYNLTKVFNCICKILAHEVMWYGKQTVCR